MRLAVPDVDGPGQAPMRIQLRRTAGWRKPASTIVVARPSKWGNPFRVDVFGPQLAVRLYERSITGYWTPEGLPPDLVEEAYRLHCWLRAVAKSRGLDPLELRGSNLACWCRAGQPCHAEVLLKLANPPAPGRCT